MEVRQAQSSWNTGKRSVNGVGGQIEGGQESSARFVHLHRRLLPDWCQRGGVLEGLEEGRQRLQPPWYLGRAAKEERSSKMSWTLVRVYGLHIRC
jgi:hypothetical protein